MKIAVLSIIADLLWIIRIRPRDSPRLHKSLKQIPFNAFERRVQLHSLISRPAVADQHNNLSLRLALLLLGFLRFTLYSFTVIELRSLVPFFPSLRPTAGVVRMR